ncbi:hypothetical protein EJ110_NYTH08454 [Nymphaea thermarum]|nr:hypothetical protein EJ110_NYTH08454 [Nymphaea thermarum]
MGRLQQHNDPNATLTPPAPTSHTDQAPPLYPQEEAPHQYPPAAAPYAAAPRSPCPFTPQQQNQPQMPPYNPHPPPPPPPPQPGLAQFQSTPFPQPEPVQPAVPFSSGPAQCYQSPATYPASGPQQFNQVHTPAEGVPYQKPYVPTPAARFGPGGQSALWTTGLFDCFDDPSNALITLFFPCVTFGQVAEILDNGQTSRLHALIAWTELVFLQMVAACATSAMMYTLIACCFGVPWILSCTYRTKLRAKYGLMESPAPDWIIHCFCDWCAICQEYRELNNRGLDPGIAFHPFPPQQQHPLHQQPQAAAFHPFPPQQQHPLHQQPQAAAFHPPPQPAVPFPPCYPPPATNPPYAPQQSNQAATPVHGVPSQNPYAPKPPPPYGPGPQYSANWTTGLFDCLEDPNSACTTSAMMYSLMAFAFGVPWILSCTYRTKLRTMYGLPESPAPDLIVHCFCDSCAICQEYRELRNRGLDPALGWQGNMMLQAQQQQATMAPPFNQHSAPVQGTPLQGAPYVQAPPAQYGRWTTGLFGCFEDPANACATSAMLYILIACCCGVPCILSCTYRTKLRGKYGLPASPAPDCIVHCLCDYCAICQAYRELKNRGLDPSIGKLFSSKPVSFFLLVFSFILFCSFFL